MDQPGSPLLGIVWLHRVVKRFKSPGGVESYGQWPPQPGNDNNYEAGASQRFSEHIYVLGTLYQPEFELCRTCSRGFSGYSIDRKPGQPSAARLGILDMGACLMKKFRTAAEEQAGTNIERIFNAS